MVLELYATAEDMDLFENLFQELTPRDEPGQTMQEMREWVKFAVEATGQFPVLPPASQEWAVPKMKTSPC